MKNKNSKYGDILKKAEEFEKLQEEFSKLIKESNINKTQLAMKVEMSISHFYSKLNNKNFTASELIKVVDTILSEQNLACTKIYKAIFDMQNLNMMKKDTSQFDSKHLKKTQKDASQ